MIDSLNFEITFMNVMPLEGSVRFKVVEKGNGFTLAKVKSVFHGSKVKHCQQRSLVAFLKVAGDAFLMETK